MGIWGGSPVGLKTKSSAKMESERVLLVDAAIKSSSLKEKGFGGIEAVGNALSKKAYY